MNDDVPADEILHSQGWRMIESGHVRRFEKDGLTLSYDSHWSVRQYFVHSANGGWGDMQEVMSRIGLVPSQDNRDFLKSAENRELIKSYLDSPEWYKDGQKSRHDRMEHLREFQRSIGSEESWLAGEEDNARRKAMLVHRLRGWNRLKYWIAAAVCIAYLAYKTIYPNAEIPFIATICAGAAVVIAGLFVMRRQNKI